MFSILGPIAEGGAQLPLFSDRVPAGFPSPAADHMERKIFLDELLDIRAPHMSLVRIEGQSMEGAGIFCGDLAVVDRSSRSMAISSSRRSIQSQCANGCINVGTM